MKVADGMFEFLGGFPVDRLSRPRKTVFDIGTKGYFENPMSDILAFYLDPHEEHGLGALPLKGFLKSAGIGHLDTNLVTAPIREKIDRIDLVLEGKDWIIAVENKVHHAAVNPFEDYEKALDRYNTRGKLPHHFILSPYDPMIRGWRWLETPKLMRALSEGIVQDSVSDEATVWAMFFKEFCRNAINVTEVVGASLMNEENFEMIVEHWDKIKKVVDAYHDTYSIVSKRLEPIAERIIKRKQSFGYENWQELGHALRFYPILNSENNSTVLILPDNRYAAGRFRVQYYVRLDHAAGRNEMLDLCADGFRPLGTEKSGTLLSFFVDSANLRDLEIHFENSIKTLQAHQLRHA